MAIDLGPSWRTSVGGGLTIMAGVLTAGAHALQSGQVSTEDLGILATAITAGLGLIAAKDRNVSNAPHPIAVARQVPEEKKTDETTDTTTPVH